MKTGGNELVGIKVSEKDHFSYTQVGQRRLNRGLGGAGEAGQGNCLREGMTELSSER